MALQTRERDHELIQQVLDGNNDAFEQLVKNNQNYIYNLLLQMGCVPEDAKGMTQAVFIQAYYSLANFKQEAKFQTWLHKIAINRCYNWFKKNKIKTVSMTEHLVRSQNISPEEKILEKENFRAIRKAIYLLPEKYRKIIKLFYFEAMSYSEIAGALNMNKRTVETRLYRARQMLKEILQEKQDGII